MVCTEHDEPELVDRSSTLKKAEVERDQRFKAALENRGKKRKIDSTPDEDGGRAAKRGKKESTTTGAAVKTGRKAVAKTTSTAKASPSTEATTSTNVILSARAKKVEKRGGERKKKRDQRVEKKKGSSPKAVSMPVAPISVDASAAASAAATDSIPPTEMSAEAAMIAAAQKRIDQTAKARRMKNKGKGRQTNNSQSSPLAASGLKILQYDYLRLEGSENESNAGESGDAAFGDSIPLVSVGTTPTREEQEEN